MMKRTFRTLLSLILCLTIAACAIPFAFAQDGLTTAPLRFGEDGKFKIMQVTDTHLNDNNVEDTVRLLGLACDAEQPDLAVLTGDLAMQATLEHTAELADALMQVFDSRDIPVAVTFGNHDSENGAYTREEVMALYNAYDCSISIDDGDALTGCGTYLIPINSSEGDELKFNLWIFDSGDYDGEGHYANVAEDQVEWYRETSEAIEARSGKKIYSIVFQHIIVPQIYDALEKTSVRGAYSYPNLYDKSSYYRFSKEYTNYGMLHEYPCPGYYDHGQFDAMKERGDVLALFTGHDHTNAFGVKYQGIDLCTSPSSRYNGGSFSTQYGYRIIELDENAPDQYDTRVVRWYDFGNMQEVKALADEREEKSLLAELRFVGFFQKFFTNLSVFVVELFTGRTVRYPD